MTLRTRTFAVAAAAALVGALTTLLAALAGGVPVALAAGLGLLAGVAAAAALAWAGLRSVHRRARTIAGRARGLSDTMSPSGPADMGRDELGDIARAIDDSAQAFGRRLTLLARERTRMQAVLACMTEGVLVTDAHGRVQLANDAARSMLQLGSRTQDVHFLELVRDPGITAALAEALEGRATAATEIWPTRDPVRRFRAQAVPVRAADASGALLVLHDVTELRQADVVRRDFVANVSHELRTPLTAIRGYLEALRDIEPAGDEAQRFLEVIARHTRRMERLVQDLLRLARLEAGQETADVAEGQVQTLITDVINDLSPALNARRQRVSVRIAPTASVIVTDRAKLQDVLRNLVENAINYGPEQGTITITVERVGDQISIAVADQGPGLPEADLLRVFERFYRGTAARSDAPAGTGLGLSIVKHLAGLMNGRVRADNRPSGGAIFTLTLPANGPSSSRDPS